MITPRQTRLVRVADLHDFRRTICSLASSRQGVLIVVPTQGAAVQLTRSIDEAAKRDVQAVTREQLYDTLHGRLPDPPRRLSAYERDAIAQAAALQAAARLDHPLHIRPGLVSELLLFYDQLRRQGQRAARFQELIEDALGSDAGDDRGVNRLLQQTRLLAETFREYENRSAASGAVDEHMLRERLVSTPPRLPSRHIIVTVADWIADPNGLYVADFDLLARLPDVAALEIVCTDNVLSSGFHQRLGEWMPGIEEERVPATRSVRPILETPGGDGSQLWFTLRDREEELARVCRGIADAAQRGEPATLERTAIVYKRPLPYLYAARETFEAAGIAWQSPDGFPLASEPIAAAVDLVLDAVESSFAREALIALLKSPHFQFGDTPVTARSVALLNRALSERRYLGGLDRLAQIADALAEEPAGSIAQLALAVSRELEVLSTPAPAASHLSALRAFLDRHVPPVAGPERFAERDARARTAIEGLLSALEQAQRAHHNPEWSVSDLGLAVRRWIERETFQPGPSHDGVFLLDDQTARYGDFDDLAIVGLVEKEWPEPPRRNIFYPPNLLRALAWPSERDRAAADRARFLDLLACASRHVTLSTITLDDEALVTRSLQLDEVPAAGLTTMTGPATGSADVFRDDRLASAHADAALVPPAIVPWAEIRRERAPADLPAFHGSVGALSSREWSVSALETYLGCPFKFLAQHVLSLEDEPEDEEIMDPRRQGQFVHAVFEAFFDAWQQSGRRAVTPANLDDARALFASVVEERLGTLSAAEAGIERTRLLGSPAAAGLGEAVLRMEAERPLEVVERLLEHRLSGPVAIVTSDGPRTITLRGKADRLDLLADGTFRLIDYKLGWPPNRARALQLPIYAVAAEQRLKGRGGRSWTLGEAAYLAFKGPKRVVPLFAGAAERTRVLADAQQRLSDTIDAIERGEFPPTPDDVYRCETCSFSAVCRKDYVGNV